MRVPLLTPLQEAFASRVDAACIRAATMALTVLFAVSAGAFLCAAGLVMLSARIGFPLAAVSVASGLAVLALATFLVGRTLASRRMAQVAAAQRQANGDIAVAVGIARSAKPLVPLAVLLAAFLLTRKSRS